MGPSGGILNSSFRVRDTPEYKHELGTAIESVASVVPDGLLVFFPSYAVMSGCLDAWQAPGNPSVWCVDDVDNAPMPANSRCKYRDRLLRLKHLVVEPRESSGMAAARLDFEAKLEGDGRTACPEYALRLTCACLQILPATGRCFLRFAEARSVKALTSLTKRGVPS